jgi:hypothetical protein
MAIICFIIIIFTIIIYQIVNVWKMKQRCKREKELLQIAKCVYQLELIKLEQITVNGKMYQSIDNVCKCLNKLQF